MAVGAHHHEVSASLGPGLGQHLFRCTIQVQHFRIGEQPPHLIQVASVHRLLVASDGDVQLQIGEQR